jgi:4-amino-4-deoxy-L-arabinose transferase-like glycosyltransferase
MSPKLITSDSSKALLKLLPLLLFYVVYVLIFAKNELHADEVRYHMFAENIVNGFYTDADNPNLMNGPGYPLFLAAFLALDLPLVVPKLANALMAFLSVFLLYRSLIYYVPAKTALLSAYVMGLYFPMFKWIRLLFSDVLSIFLLCCLIFLVLKVLRSDRFAFRQLILPALLLAFLIWVKVFFALVILTGIVTALIYYAFVRKKAVLKWAAILVLGYGLATPWLVYTYQMTGRVWYWSSNGGEQLYWMSSHLDKEYGNWIESTSVLNRDFPEMDQRHLVLYDSAYTKPWVERNDHFFHIAKENIKNDPAGYVYNVIANAIRMVADGPNSYYDQSLRPYLFLFFDLILLIPLVLTIIPAWKNRQHLPFEIIAVCFLILIYWGGSIFIASIQRYFIIIVPFILLWISFIFTQFTQISFKNQWSKSAPS